MELIKIGKFIADCRKEKKNKKLLANMYVMTITVEEDKQ